MSILLATFISALLAGSLLLNILAKGMREQQGASDSDVQLIAPLRGRWIILYATVGGTLTSLASVYLFFLLQASVFGWATFVTLVALPVGALVAQLLSRRALTIAESDDLFKEALKNGTMTSLHCARSTRSTAELCRFLTIANIVAVIWLELKVLSQIAAANLFPNVNNPTLWISLISATVILLLVQYIVRFGMNGVVLTDALYWPLVILSVLLIGIASLAGNYEVALDDIMAVAAATNLTPGLLTAFLLNAILINAIYQVARDDQWLRLSAFRDEGFTRANPAANSLVSSAALSMPIWLILIVIGLVVGAIDTDGQLSLLDIVENSLGSSPILIPILLTGMFAAVMSTVDNQLFAARRLLSLDTVNNQVSDKRMNVVDSYVYSIGLAAIFFIVTYTVQTIGLDNSELVFSCLGLPAVLFPAILFVLLNRRPNVFSILVPLTVYGALSVYGYSFSQSPQFFSMLTPPVSLLIGVIFGIFGTSKNECRSK